MKSAAGGRCPINVVAGESYWWCACGRSKAQPFCDGSHKGTAFRPQEWKAEASEEVWFCACKRSSHQPLCDGSHKTPALMPDLLLELFSEEIPARMQARAAEDLRKARHRPAGGGGARL